MAHWTAWILASSFFLALYDLAKKASVGGNAVLPVLFFSTCFGCASYAVSLAACGGFGAALAVCRAGRGCRSGAFEWRWTIPCVGILLAAADWLYFHGLAHPDAPVSAASLMRRFSVVITFVLGARFFHETNLVRKAVALAVVLAGIVLICLGR